MMEHLILIGIYVQSAKIYILRRLYFFKFTTRVLKTKIKQLCLVSTVVVLLLCVFELEKEKKRISFWPTAFL